MALRHEWSISTLWDISRQYQSLADKLDLLQPQKWLETDGAKLDRLVQEIGDLRMGQKNLLNAPETRSLIEHYEQPSEFNALSPQNRSLIHHMRRAGNLYACATDQQIREMESSMKDSEAEWLTSFDIAQEEGNEAAFQAQIPALKKIFSQRRELAQASAAAMGTLPSETVLEEWNPGFRNKDVDRLFGKAVEIYPEFITLLSEDLEHRPKPQDPFNDALYETHFTPEKTQAFFVKIRDMMLESAGWTEKSLHEHGVTLHEMGLTENAFCWGTRREIYQTVYNKNFIEGLGNCLHETGHMLYLLSLNRLGDTIKDTPLGQVNGYGIHEVAAMYCEQSGFSGKFWELITPMIREHFNVEGPEWEPENLRQLMNAPNLDNMEWGTSELSLMPNMYFRSMAERKIMDGQMEVEDLPQFWAQTMQETTGIPHAPEDYMVDASHWFDRQTGYFPAYWVGTLCATRLMENTEEKAEHAGNLSDYFGTHYEVLEKSILQHASADQPMALIERELGGRPEDFLPLYMKKRLAGNYLGKKPSAKVGAFLQNLENSGPQPAAPQYDDLTP